MTMRSEATGTLSVSLTSAPDEVPLSGTATQRTLKLGAVSYTTATSALNVRLTRHSTGFVVATRFGLTVQDASSQVANATVLAAVAIPETQFSFRLDGVPLSLTPQVVQGQAKVGQITEHLLEIEVPNSVTEKDSQLQNAILVQVIAN